jgi:ubiquinone/menaquinone biosynthesis C-methylase UbiE
MGHAVWEAVQRLLAPDYEAMLRRTVRDRLGAHGPGRWLDAGCGPRVYALQSLPGTLVGIDSAAAVLRTAQRNGVVCVCGSTTALPFAEESFDGVVCFGLLHHLSDEDADTSLTEMRRVTRPGGSVVLFDNVKPVSAIHRPLAALLRALDRGRNVRTEAEFRHLLAGHGFSIGPPITYAWAGLEGCWATLKVAGAAP